MTPALIISGQAPPGNFDAIAGDAQHLLPHVIVAYGAQSYASGLHGAFARAAEFGCTHAITLDASRDHALSDVNGFLDAIQRHPNAIVTGVRRYRHGDLPAVVRLARGNCDFWTWAEAGKWIHDSAHGLRAYPLASIRDLVLRCEHYEADVELLVKAMWMGVPVVEFPLESEQEAERPTAVLPVNDLVAFSSLTANLMFQRLVLPAPIRAAMHRAEFASLPLGSRLRLIIKGAVMHHCDRPTRFAAGVGIGVFFGIVPIWGFQLLAAATTAHFLRLSKPLVLAACHISLPLTLPLILYASLLVGHFLYHGQLSGLPRLDQLQRPQLLVKFLGEYLVGSMVLAAFAGAFAASLAYLAAATIKSLRGNT